MWSWTMDICKELKNALNAIHNVSAEKIFSLKKEF